MKTCRTCKIEKEIIDFYVHKQMLDGHLNICKECTKERVRNTPRDRTYTNKYDINEKGVIRMIYKTQLRNSKLRGHPPPEYTREELKYWLYENGFKRLYDSWVKSRRKKGEKPSVDRLNSFAGYSFDNIKLVTWKVNRANQSRDIKSGEGTSGKMCKAVEQFDVDGNFIKEFHSQNEAARQLKINNKDISSVCLGKTQMAGGYVWKFKK